MKRIVYSIFLIFLIQPGISQDLFLPVLDSVLANNKVLSAGRNFSEAQKLNAKTGIYLVNPSVSYDRLTNSTGKYSEMVISQSFDFPSAYVHKGKIADLSATQSDERYRQTKLEVLASVAQVYAELIYTNRKISILTKRKQMAIQLQTRTEKRLSAGDANIFEINRVRGELAKTQSELQITESHRETLMVKLAELNGGKPIMVTDTVFPVLNNFDLSDNSADSISSRSPQLKQWEAEMQIAGQKVKLQQSLSLPKFEIGYRQDNSTGQTFRGFHAGITIPLFENKNSVKSAQAQQQYAAEAVNASKLEVHSNVSQLLNEYRAVLQSLNNMTEVYKTLNTPDLLVRAFSTGHMNYTEFFTEYENYQQTALYIEELNQKATSLQLMLYVLTSV